MRVILIALCILSACIAQAQNAASIIRQASIAKNNGEYKLALNSYESAIDVALARQDTTAAINALNGIVSIGISLNNPELSLNADTVPKSVSDTGLK